MAQIKIRSNPYLKKISYEYYDDNLGKYIEINYGNNPNCKLIGEDYKSTFLMANIGDILEAIYDTYYNKDEKIRILFEGTKEEFDAITLAAKDYNSDILVTNGEQYLMNEQEILSFLEEIKNKLELNVEIKETNNVYQKIDAMRSALENYYNEKKKELDVLNTSFDALNSQHDSKVNILIEAVKKHNDSESEKTAEKSDIKKIVNDYISSYVVDKKTLEMKYDEIKDGVIAESKEKETKKDDKSDEYINKKENAEKEKKPEKNKNVEEPIEYTEDADKKVKEKKKLDAKAIAIAKDIVREGEKAVKDALNNRIDVKVATGIGGFFVNAAKALKNDIDANKESDKLFLEYTNDLYSSSFYKVAEEIKNKIYKDACEKENEIKNHILEIISKNSEDDAKETINKALNSIKLSNDDIFDIGEIPEHKFKNIDVKAHLPGIPNLGAIRNEWTTELKKYITLLIHRFNNIEYVTLDDWEEKIMQELKDNIIKLNPNVKEQISAIDELRKKKKKLESEYEIATMYYKNVSDITSFKE